MYKKPLETDYYICRGSGSTMLEHRASAVAQDGQTKHWLEG